MKNVAGTWAWASVWRIAGRPPSSPPASNVRATTRRWVGSSVGTCPRTAAGSGPACGSIGLGRRRGGVVGVDVELDARGGVVDPVRWAGGLEDDPAVPPAHLANPAAMPTASRRPRRLPNLPYILTRPPAGWPENGGRPDRKSVV